jgi:hypothetical protein
MRERFGAVLYERFFRGYTGKLRGIEATGYRPFARFLLMKRGRVASSPYQGDTAIGADTPRRRRLRAARLAHHRAPKGTCHET